MFREILFVVLVHACTGRNLEPNVFASGHRPPHVTPAGRIINGTNVTRADQAPYVARIIINLNDAAQSQALCTGSLIRKGFVLTAAHCLRKPFTVDSVTLGVYDQNETGAAQSFWAANHTVHPSHPGTGSADDVAVIKLNRRALLQPGVVETVQMAPGTTYPSRQHLYDNQTATLFGWGLISHKTQQESSEVLQTLEGRVAPYAECSGARNARAEALCVARGSGGGSGVACMGDSGGPLVANGTLIGVVSKKTADFCEDGVYSIYTRVDYHQDWIKKAIADMK